MCNDTTSGCACERVASWQHACLLYYIGVLCYICLPPISGSCNVGHRPQKRPRPVGTSTAPLPGNESAAQIGLYMTGDLKDEPWHAFGLSKAPILGGDAAASASAALFAVITL